MARCRQATSHYPSQSCQASVSPYRVTRLQWVTRTPYNDARYFQIKYIFVNESLNLSAKSLVSWCQLGRHWRHGELNRSVSMQWITHHVLDPAWYIVIYHHYDPASVYYTDIKYDLWGYGHVRLRYLHVVTNVCTWSCYRLGWLCCAAVSSMMLVIVCSDWLIYIIMMTLLSRENDVLLYSRRFKDTPYPHPVPIFAKRVVLLPACNVNILLYVNLFRYISSSAFPMVIFPWIRLIIATWRYRNPFS